MNIETGNLFASIADPAGKELFVDLVRSDNVVIQHIVSYGQASPESGWYDQQDNEWVMLLQGEARLEFDNGDIVEMVVGDYVNIPAHVRHRVASTAPDTATIWLAVHYL